MKLNQIVWLDFDYLNKHYEGEAIPCELTSDDLQSPAFDIYFDNEYNGTLLKNNNFWNAEKYLDNAMIKIIGNKLMPFLNG